MFKSTIPHISRRALILPPRVIIIIQCNLIYCHRIYPI